MSPRNVVVVYLDDTPPGHSWYEHMPYLSSQFDTDHGSVQWFPNFTCQQPFCGPARAVMLTGRYSAAMGLQDNDSLAPFEGGLDVSQYLPVRLQRVGYKTGHFGKALNYYPWDQGAAYVQPGWSRFVADTSGSGTGAGDGHYYSYALNRDGVVTAMGDTDADYITDVLTNEADDWLSTVRAPFYAYISHPAPHVNASNDIPVATRHQGMFGPEDVTDRPNFNVVPDAAQPQWLTTRTALTGAEEDEYRGIIADSYGALQAVDEGIQTLVETLDARGLLDDTVIIVTSDNGDGYGSHRVVQKNRPIEENLTPGAVIRWPGATSGTNLALLQDVDIPVTIADLANAPAGHAPDGMSFRALLEGETTDYRTAAMSQFISDATTIQRWASLRETRWKFVTNKPATGAIRRALYDLDADPYELANLEATNSAKADEMYAELLRVLPDSYRDYFTA